MRRLISPARFRRRGIETNPELPCSCVPSMVSFITVRRQGHVNISPLGYNVAQFLEISAMTDNSVVRVRIDARTKREAAAVLKKIGLTLSDAFRLLLVRVA